mgnify:CR=1 FL=1
MIRAFQWDLARQVERLDWLLAQLPRYAEWGYQEVYLHLEDAIEYPSLPGVARADAYSRRELERLVDAATRVGIKVVPIINLLGHTQYLIKVPELRDLNELRDPDGTPREHGQICPVHPAVLDVAAKLLRDVAPFCTAGKVHVGLDESFHLGQHPRSRREIARIGRAAHFANYVGRLHKLAGSLQLNLGIWADMLYFLPEAIPLLPTDIAVYEWYYYPFRRRPRVELFNFAESNMGEQLRARGLEYWGCPMNGAFRHEPMPHFTDRLENAISWWQRCRRLNAAGFLMTAWEPNRLALELTTVVDAAAASLWLDPARAPEPQWMLERGFERVYGKAGARKWTRLALSGDRYPFSGYPRWEINTSWSTVSRRESVAPYRGEERFFCRAVREAQAGAAPAALRASLEFRHYLAQRDIAVRTGAPRPALGPALRAAREMWAQTRDPNVIGPNERMLRADAGRERPTGWQLCYRVNNVAPALQRVGVEQLQPDGTWKLLQACHTIEFQGRAARPRGGLIREHAAPVHWTGDVHAFPRLRIVLQGLGRVRIEQIELVHGRIRHLATVTVTATVKPTMLGRPAPRRGWPEFTWNQNQAVLELTWESSAETGLSPSRRPTPHPQKSGT